MSNDRAYLDLKGRQLLLVKKTDVCPHYCCMDSECVGTIGNHKPTCDVCNSSYKEAHFYIDHCGSCRYLANDDSHQYYCNHSANDK